MVVKRTFFGPLLSAALLLPGTVLAGTSIFRETYADHPGTSVEVESVFSPAARSGALPFLVVIRNGTSRDRVWTLQFREGNPGRTLITETVHQVEVKSGSEARHEIVVPFAPEFTASSYRRLQVEIRSPGLPPAIRSTGFQSVATLPEIALSQSLASRSITRLDEVAKRRNSSDQRFGTTYDPEELPTSWIGLSGLDVLMIDLEAWSSLGEAQRIAVIEWVRLGGSLDIFVSEEARPRIGIEGLGIEGLLTADPEEDFARLSLGLVTLRTWSGRELNSNVLPQYVSRSKRAELLERDYRISWNLAKDFGTREFNAMLIFFLLLGFAILVAPVNLFYFAGKGKRHRLFLTTPLISVAACLVVMLIIFLSDGLGGRGARVTFADLQPRGGEMRLYLTQEQVSRTGVMTSPSFVAERPFSLEPVQLPESAFNALTTGGNRSTVFRFIGNRYSGGFFQSRSEQGFLVRASEPSRARLEWRGDEGAGGAPELVSRLPSPVTALYYRSTDGELWRTPEGEVVPPGSPLPLEPAAEKEFNDHLREMTKNFSPGQADRIRRLAREGGRFFAATPETAPYFVATHPRIRWETEEVLLSGSVVPPPGSAASPDRDE